MNYDATAGMVETPAGIGRFVEFDRNCGVVTVEINQCFMFFPAETCYVREV